MKQSRYVEAEQVVRRAIALKPDFPHLHEDLGSIFAMQQRFEEAEPCFREAQQKAHYVERGWRADECHAR